MILEVEKGKFSIDLSQVESIEQISELAVMLFMKSGKTHKVNFNYPSIVSIWQKHHGEEMAYLKNIDSNTFRPRI